MQQLTKPELLNGELVVNVQLTNQNVKNIHEALYDYLQRRSMKNNESTYREILDLREEVLELRRILNPS
jgi:hypothetical protein